MATDGDQSGLLEQLAALGVARRYEYFGVWAAWPAALRSAARGFARVNLHIHVESYRALGGDDSRRDPSAYEVDEGVAIIELRGGLMKARSSLGGTSTVDARRALRRASRAEAVKAIALKIDSPGGTIAGMADLADEIVRAAKSKPLDAYIDDLATSGAYWAASQARRVYANRSAIVGSIGMFAVLEDWSKGFADRGVLVHVVRAGEHKGAGSPGTKITDSQLADSQRIVDSLNEQFLRGVAAGRRLSLSRVRELADGRVHVGQAAVDRGLVDGIESFDDTLARLRTAAAK